MIVSKYGKSYDTADGSEQQQEPRHLSRGPANDDGSAERWADDGGAAARPPPAANARSRSKKPAWSVLSLRDLLKAIRPGKRPESAAAIRDRQDGDRQRDRQVKADASAQAARIDRDRYRNAWEQS